MGRQLKQWGIGLVSLTVMLGAYVVAGPYLAIHRLRAAALENDVRGMHSYIDDASVRNSFKQQIMTAVAQQGPHPAPGSAAAIVDGMDPSALGPFLDRIVDLYLAPEGMLQLMNGFTKPKWGPHPVAADAPEVDMNYVSSRRFEVIIQGPAPLGTKIRFVLGRDGLAWKLVDIRMP